MTLNVLQYNSCSNKVTALSLISINLILLLFFVCLFVFYFVVRQTSGSIVEMRKLFDFVNFSRYPYGHRQKKVKKKIDLGIFVLSLTLMKLKYKTVFYFNVSCLPQAISSLERGFLEVTSFLSPRSILLHLPKASYIQGLSWILAIRGKSKWIFI